MDVLEKLSEEECYLWALLSDPSGLDQAEFCWFDAEAEDNVWRAWAFQWAWFRDLSPLQIDQAGRSVGKSLSIKLRAFAFPFVHPGQEMSVTAPELVHLNPIIGLIENQFLTTRLGREMLPKSAHHGITHRPFEMDFRNGARIFGRIPQRDGKGIKGCCAAGTLILTKRGLVPIEDVVIGDDVWTHQARWRPVIEVQSYVEDDVWAVDGQGSPTMHVSGRHKFLVRNNIAKNPAKQKRRLGPEVWCAAPSLVDSHSYWASPAEFPGELAVPPVAVEHGNSRTIPMTEDFWWLVGRFIADGHTMGEIAYDGWRSKTPVVEKQNLRVVRRRINIACVPGVDQDDIVSRLSGLGLPATVINRDHSSADLVQCSSTPWARWLDEHCGKGAEHKRLPAFVLFLSETNRRAVLDGYIAGDGSKTDPRPRITVSSASKALVIGMKLLAQSLGFAANYTVVQPHITHIRGIELKKQPLLSHRVQITWTGHPIRERGFLWAKVHTVEKAEPRVVYNPIVLEDHSYIADGTVSHNTHPLWLEMDESQDYPDPGWIEIIETLKRGHEGAVWRAHGVTRGVRDYFYKFTQPDSGWRVHRITAMHRPTWSAEERQEKIESYGSRDNPDYRRNVLGLHGDATNPLFVLHRLMENVDSDQNSAYNTAEYKHFRVNAEMLTDMGGDIRSVLDFPLSHLRKYKTFWVGMDVGYTNHPSEILIFADDGKDELAKFRLLVRIHLERISHGDQVMTIKHVVDTYKPKAFAMDKTGLGLPLFQDIQERWPSTAHIIKGYNFSSKILVDFDKTIELDEYKGDIVKDAGLERNVLEYASDVLRDMVDHHRLVLPWDTDLLGEFQGQTYVVVRDTMNQYGKRSYSQGKFHALDAARMAALGKVQTPIEAFVDAQRNKFEPVTPVFIGF